MWVKFTADYNYRKPAFTIAYKEGMTLNVPSEAATLAIAAGKAVRMRKARKDEEPQEWQSSEVEREAYPSESTYKNGQPQPTNMGMKLAVDS